MSDTQQLGAFDAVLGDVVPLSSRLFGQLARLRYQVLGALLIAVLLPTMVRWGDDVANWYMPLQLNAAFASSVAIVGGLLALRQLRGLPGVRQSYYVVPVLLVSFLVVLSALLLLRIEYNRYLFPTSFVLTVLWVLFSVSLARRHTTLTIGVVPGVTLAGLEQVHGIAWRPLDTPSLPRHRLGALVVDLRQDIGDEWERFIADCALRGIRVFHIQQLRESLTGRLEIEHLSENTLGSINPNGAYLQLKQLLDWPLAVAVLAITWPFLLAIAVLIKLDSKGPVLFRQLRMGYGGVPFSVFKFRTMTHSAAPQGRDAAVTLDHDPRITRLGHFLRKSRIDELPQIINILCGQMSWIGPRPEALELSQWYEGELPFYRYRHIVRPGISGWAQVNQGHVTAVDAVRDKLHYDFYYIRNFSPWLDILIVFKTIRTVLTGCGAK